MMVASQDNRCGDVPVPDSLVKCFCDPYAAFRIGIKDPGL